MHHIVSDGWSLSVLLADLRALYAAHVSSNAVAASRVLPPLSIQYADYAQRQRQRDLSRESRYWADVLRGYSEPIDLGMNGSATSAQHGELGQVHRRISPALAGLIADEGPQGPIETAIVAHWREALGVEHIGRHENLFALGGDSLMAAKVMARLGKALQVRLTVRSLFDTRTVHALANLVQAERARLQGGAPSGNEGTGFLNVWWRMASR